MITAVLDTACRPGEILSLQWKDVSIERRELTIRAEKEKTRRERAIPISSRLLATIEMRQFDPAGRPYGVDDYVFGDDLGRRRRLKTVCEAWNRLAEHVELRDFHLADLRHEAASRFDEAGVPIVYVSTLLGHSNLATTSRYLNINRRGLHLAMQQFEERRSATTTQQSSASSDSVAHSCHTDEEGGLAAVSDIEATNPSKLLPS